MSDQTDRGVAPMARVIEVDAGEDLAPRRPLAPRIIPTERTERVTPSEPAPVAVVAPDAPRRRDRVITFGLARAAALFVGWLAVDAAGWIAAAFERSTALGVLAATAVTAGVAGAGAVIARELGSLFRLRSVEAIHRRLADQRALPTDARKAIAAVLAVVPREREIDAGIEAFQRQVQLHHATAQQIEILSRTVLKPPHPPPEAHLPTPVLRAFAITPISPTPLPHPPLLLACAVPRGRAMPRS